MKASGSSPRYPRTSCGLPIALCFVAATWFLGGLRPVNAGMPAAVVEESAYVKRSWQWEAGLPDNSVGTVAQTPDGFIWITTLGGLVRFDGLGFQRFSLSNLPLAGSRGVRAQHVDRHGRWWLVFDETVVAFEDAETYRVFGLDEARPTRSLTGLAEDLSGGIWLGYRNGRLICLSNGNVRSLGRPLQEPDDAPLLLTCDREGRLWCARAKRVGVLEEGAFREVASLQEPVQQIAGCQTGGIWACTARQLLNLKEGSSPSVKTDFASHGVRGPVTALREDRRRVLWLGTATDGLWRLGSQGLVKEGTSHRSISCLTEDAEGNLLVGTLGGGLNRLRPGNAAMMRIGDIASSEPVASVADDSAGSLWVVMEDGQVARSDGASWSLVSREPDWTGGAVNCVAASRAGAIWLGTRERGLLRFERGKYESWRTTDGLADDSVRTMLVTASGDLWLGFSNQRKVQRLRDGQFLTLPLPESARLIRAIAEGAAGKIWIATADGQLFCVQNNVLAAEPELLPGEERAIRCLLPAPDGSLWIGFGGAGIGRLKAGHLTLLTTAKGLHDDYVSQMIGDDHGWIWCAGRRGLFRVRMEGLTAAAERNERVQTFLLRSDNEGVGSLQAVAYSGTGATRGHDGSLYFPMHTGLVVVKPDIFHATTATPHVLVDTVEVDGETLGRYASRSPLQPKSLKNVLSLPGSGSELELPPGHRKIEFRFTAPSLTAPESVFCRYQLKGFDEGWIEADTRRSVSYPRLPAGHYEFRVAACNEAGIWEPTGTTLMFAVRPFVWNTWWFRVGVGSLLIAGASAVVRYVSQRRLRAQVRLMQQQASLDRERARIARDMHDTLGASLTQINLLGELASREATARPQVTEYVKKMTTSSHALVQQLDEIVWAVDPENDTLDDLATYISQFATEFLADSPIRLRMKIPAIPPQLRLTTDVRHNLFLAVREALNNVVRHSAATETTITIEVEGDALIIVIEDNGQGFNVTGATSRHGLVNLKQRLAELGGTCRIESAPGRGTKVTLKWSWRDRENPPGSQTGSVQPSAASTR
jgi:signal transduction histidine kinase/ligand-binding sensor domain-containing protein